MSASSMRLGFVGLGELGLPFAALAASRGHRVRGFDLDPGRMSVDWYRTRPGLGEGLDLLGENCIDFCPLREVVRESELVFVVVPTPSRCGYGGERPVPEEAAGYDLAPLRSALQSIAEAAGDRTIVVAIVSTTTPGTIDRLALEVGIPATVLLAHTPAFSAVGSMIDDLLDPEFVLIGTADQRAARVAERFYASLHDVPQVVTSIASAELIKLSYNAFISMKLGFANALLEVAHHTDGCDVDEVTSCLSRASRRLLSPAYLTAGMGDGGGCHPKDGLALSSLASDLGLSADPFGESLTVRDRQTRWLADLIHGRATPQRPVWILGTAYKPGVPLETGSPSLLLQHFLRQRGVEASLWDPIVPGRNEPAPPDRPCLFVVATRQEEIRALRFPPGSLVIDPWGFLDSVPSDIELVRIGRTASGGAAR